MQQMKVRKSLILFIQTAVYMSSLSLEITGPSKDIKSLLFFVPSQAISQVLHYRNSIHWYRLFVRTVWRNLEPPLIWRVWSVAPLVYCHRVYLTQFAGTFSLQWCEEYISLSLLLPRLFIQLGETDSLIDIRNLLLSFKSSYIATAQSIFSSVPPRTCSAWCEPEKNGFDNGRTVGYRRKCTPAGLI